MGLDFKEEESIIDTSEASKKALHLWLCDVKKLMTTISRLCRDRRLLSRGINNLALSLHKPVCNFRGETALPEHIRSASCLVQRRLCQGASSWGEKGKPSPHFGDDVGVQKKHRISLVNCLLGGWQTGKEKQSLFQAPQDWLVTCPRNMD